MENTISVYDALAIQKQCFITLGETGKELAKLGSVMRGWVNTLKYCAEVDDRIQLKCQSSKVTDMRDAVTIKRLDRALAQLKEGAA